jgi:alkaline phosphatase D
MNSKFAATVAKSILAVALIVSANAAQTNTTYPVIAVDHGPNSPAQQSKPYVVLVSLDGFRYDYPQKYGAPHLDAIAQRGASAPDGMYPSYPSVTFPNHYAIITGLYPEHTGIVANKFYDPARHERYSYTDAKSVSDGTWYSGVPLWSLAEQQSMRTACFFWPASEAEIAAQRPSFYLLYESKVPSETKINQVVAWLNLPPAQRPHFITVYFPEVDGAGHAFGPDSPLTAAAVKDLDNAVGRLDAALSKLPLRINIIIIADHGMETTQGDWINLDAYADLSNFETDGALLYPKSEEAAQKAYEQLRSASPKFKAYRRRDVPPELHYSDNPRIGDPVVIATGPYWIRARNDLNEPHPHSLGQHGYDPYRMKSMRAVFYAAGPDIRPHTTLPPFDNVSIYPMIAKILDLPVGTIDGDPTVLAGILTKK